MLLSLGISESSISLFEKTQDAVMLMDIAGTIKYANLSFYSLLGYDSSEIVGKNYTEIQCDPPINFEVLLRTLTLKQSTIELFNCTKKDGTQTPLTASFSFIHDTIAFHKGVLIVIKNKLLETSAEKNFLAQQNNLLMSMNHRKDEVCILYDMINWRSLFCSDTIESFLGWTSEEYNNGGWAFALSTSHPEDVPLIQERYQKEVARRKIATSDLDSAPVIFEYRKRHKNGAYKWVRSESWVLNRDENGILSHMLIFLRDISMEKIKEQLEHNPNLLELIQNGVEHIKISRPIPATNSALPSNIQLSTREKEILDLIKKGLSSKKISSKLSLTVNTVNTYRKNLMNKLHAKNSAELVQIAMKQNIS